MYTNKYAIWIINSIYLLEKLKIEINAINKSIGIHCPHSVVDYTPACKAGDLGSKTGM